MTSAGDKAGSGIRGSAAHPHSLQADLQAELRAIEQAVASGTRDAGRSLKTELRRQVASAGLGQRLAHSWRDKHYPNQKLDAASLPSTPSSRRSELRSKPTRRS